jgi:hypothetical protein
MEDRVRNPEDSEKFEVLFHPADQRLWNLSAALSTHRLIRFDHCTARIAIHGASEEHYRTT